MGCAGDWNKVDIGAFTTVGDRAVVCTSPTVEGKADADVKIGDYVSIGAFLLGARVAFSCLQYGLFPSGNIFFVVPSP